MKPHILDKDDIEYLNSDFLEEKPKKRPLAVLFMILLIVCFSLFFYLQNFISSETIDENTLIFSNIKIKFINNSLEKIQREYFENQAREIKACLYGEIEDNTYVISAVEFPEVSSANVFHVSSSSCPISAIADLHSHPKNSCIASPQDISNLEKRRKYQKEYLMLIMCNTDRFSLIN